MTNAEKYKEVFGFRPDLCCPTLNCCDCPLNERCFNTDGENALTWWNSEYKEVTNGS